jgi:hypothetical protein
VTRRTSPHYSADTPASQPANATADPADEVREVGGSSRLGTLLRAKTSLVTTAAPGVPHLERSRRDTIGEESTAGGAHPRRRARCHGLATRGGWQAGSHPKHPVPLGHQASRGGPPTRLSEARPCEGREPDCRSAWAKTPSCPWGRSTPRGASTLGLSNATRLLL